MKTKLVLAAAAALATMPVTMAAAAPAASSHPKLIVVYLENHSLKQIVGNADAPYLNALWQSSSVEQFTRFFGVKHSSFNDYSALAAGEAVAGGASRAGQFSNSTVWDQLSAAGDSWGVYEESVPTACYTKSKFFGTTGEYEIGHNPAMPFASIAGDLAKCADVQPLTALATASPLPDVSFVTPNLCDDMHGVTASVASQHGYTQCVTDADLITRGDKWLSGEVPQWLGLNGGHVDVLIMFDEGEKHDRAGRQGTGGGHVYAILTGAGVTGGHHAASYNAYNLLAAIEKDYGLTRLGNAAGSTPIPLP